MESTYIETHNCPFIGIETEDVYYCFRNEACCEGGCCPKAFLTTYRMCYVWVTILAVLFVCSGGLKLCKTRRRLSARDRFFAQHNQIERNQNITSHNNQEIANLELYLQNTPTPRLSNLDERINLRNLLGTADACHVAIDRYIACRNARNRENILPPPPYHTVGVKQTSCDPFDPPPHYSTIVSDSNATKMMVAEVSSSENRTEEVYSLTNLQRDGGNKNNNHEEI